MTHRTLLTLRRYGPCFQIYERAIELGSVGPIEQRGSFELHINFGVNIFGRVTMPYVLILSVATICTRRLLNESCELTSEVLYVSIILFKKNIHISSQSN